MHSDKLEGILLDIQLNIDLADRFSAGLSFDDFKNDAKTLYAVTRCLEIISEASRKLPDELKARHGTIPWRQIAGSGNVYRHEYGSIAEQIIWDTVRGGLSALRAAVAQELTALRHR